MAPGAIVALFVFLFRSVLAPRCDLSDPSTEIELIHAVLVSLLAPRCHYPERFRLSAFNGSAYMYMYVAFPATRTRTRIHTHNTHTPCVDFIFSYPAA